jgi:hypothetical protein
MHSLARHLLLTAALAAPAICQIDRESDARIDYQHLRHASLAEVQNWSAMGYRLGNFELAATNPLSLDCSMVRNTGPYAAGWYFFYDKTRAELWNLVNQHNARIVDLERYEVGGQERLAALLFVNTGAQQKAWHWHTGIPQGSVYSTVSALGDRAIDIEPYVENGQRLYHVISIANVGADQKPWWVYTNTTTANVQSLVAQHNARVYDFELESLLPTTVCCVLVRDSLRCLTLWNDSYGSGFDADVENGGRVTGLGRQGITGRVITMLDNGNPFTASGVPSSGTNGLTLHSASGNAFTGTPVVYRVEHLRPWAPAFIAYGFTSQSLSLAGLGAPGCWAYLAPVATELRFANGSGVATDTLNLPLDPSLAGLPLLTQMLASDPGINPMGLQTSNRLQTVVRHW